MSNCVVTHVYKFVIDIQKSKESNGTSAGTFK